ncbi:hypothetical protein WJX72_001444 [[Myrmecia] bisecta]|uniref:TFIIS N-terminal domain-containing protein n=1 Tax=[Myrmecia] bisecta TaxID=41462 RepID=A0AAW1PRQ0_9CHLO
MDDNEAGMDRGVLVPVFLHPHTVALEEQFFQGNSMLHCRVHHVQPPSLRGLRSAIIKPNNTSEADIPLQPDCFAPELEPASPAERPEPSALHMALLHCYLPQAQEVVDEEEMEHLQRVAASMPRGGVDIPVRSVPSLATFINPAHHQLPARAPVTEDNQETGTSRPAHDARAALQAYLEGASSDESHSPPPGLRRLWDQLPPLELQGGQQPSPAVDLSFWNASPQPDMLDIRRYSTAPTPDPYAFPDEETLQPPPGATPRSRVPHSHPAGLPSSPDGRAGGYAGPSGQRIRQPGEAAAMPAAPSGATPPGHMFLADAHAAYAAGFLRSSPARGAREGAAEAPAVGSKRPAAPAEPAPGDEGLNGGLHEQGAQGGGAMQTRYKRARVAAPETPEATELEELKHNLRHVMGAGDVQSALLVLAYLGKLRMTYSLLASSQIAAAVNPLVQHPHEPLAVTAKYLVQQWTALVRQTAQGAAADPTALQAIAEEAGEARAAGRQVLGEMLLEVEAGGGDGAAYLAAVAELEGAPAADAAAAGCSGPAHAGQAPGGFAAGPSQEPPASSEPAGEEGRGGGRGAGGGQGQGRAPGRKSPGWTEDEQALYVDTLRNAGRSMSALKAIFPHRSEETIRNFYSNHRVKLLLDQAVLESGAASTRWER